MAVSATLAVKVSQEFARKYRAFCESHFLQVGKFTEQALLDVMEDYHFGGKAQAVLSRTSGEAVDHREYFAAKKPKTRKAAPGAQVTTKRRAR